MRAAEVAATADAEVTLYDAKASVGRKFLVAGKGGMNLTNSESMQSFFKRYSGVGLNLEFWEFLLRRFPPEAFREWAYGLGVGTFVASSGRVYLKDLKAAPLLRAWVERLRRFDVRFSMNHRLVSLRKEAGICMEFANGCTDRADAVVLALGGASWPRTGSDGSWTKIFDELGISIQPLEAANCGWEHKWDADFLKLAEGKPLKNVAVRVGESSVAGELLITRYGIEGGPIYALGRALREMAKPAITIDLKPAHTHQQLVRKMESVRRNFADQARLRWKLGDAAFALLKRCEWMDADALATEAKGCVITLCGPREVSEAISTGGGVSWSEIDSNFMLKNFPGVFVAGEMIDWEAPTGGYLLQGCFATGSLAGESALGWVRKSAGPQ